MYLREDVRTQFHFDHKDLIPRMIQKIKGKHDKKELLIVTNSTNRQALSKIEQAGLSGLKESKIHFFASVKTLKLYLNLTGSQGSILFMFFSGTQFIERTLEELIDAEGRQDKVPFLYLTTLAIVAKNEGSIIPIINSSQTALSPTTRDIYLYFDGSVSDVRFLGGISEDFCSIATISGLVVSRLESLGKCAGVFIDDYHLAGPRHQAMIHLVRNFPQVEFNLTSAN